MTHNPNCDGSGPHSSKLGVRLYPIGGGGNLILCHACWIRENHYAQQRGKESGCPENWSQPNWHKAVQYGEEALS